MRSNQFDILVCPATRQPLSLADHELVDRVNQAIKDQKLRDKAGDLLSISIDELLLREDQKVGYPVIDSIPHMLIDGSILMEELPRPKS